MANPNSVCHLTYSSWEELPPTQRGSPFVLDSIRRVVAPKLLTEPSAAEGCTYAPNVTPLTVFCSMVIDYMHKPKPQIYQLIVQKHQVVSLLAMLTWKFQILFMTIQQILRVSPRQPIIHAVSVLAEMNNFPQFSETQRILVRRLSPLCISNRLKVEVVVLNNLVQMECEVISFRTIFLFLKSKLLALS